MKYYQIIFSPTGGTEMVAETVTQNWKQVETIDLTLPAADYSKISFEKEFSAGCQPRYPIKIPITTWKSLSPPRGLQLYPSCQARCPVKTSNEMESYPAPSAAQLLTMLLHREHFYSCL